MVIRILLLGSPHERNAFKKSLRDAFAGQDSFTIVFDEYMRLTEAITAFDVGEPPKYVVATPSALIYQAIDLFRHIRGCGRTMMLVLWRYRPVDPDSAATLAQQNAKTVVSDVPDLVTREVVKAQTDEQRHGIRSASEPSRP